MAHMVFWKLHEIIFWVVLDLPIATFWLKPPIMRCHTMKWQLKNCLASSEVMQEISCHSSFILPTANISGPWKFPASRSRPAPGKEDHSGSPWPSTPSSTSPTSGQDMSPILGLRYGMAPWVLFEWKEFERMEIKFKGQTQLPLKQPT